MKPFYTYIPNSRLSRFESIISYASRFSILYKIYSGITKKQTLCSCLRTARKERLMQSIYR